MHQRKPPYKTCLRTRIHCGNYRVRCVGVVTLDESITLRTLEETEKGLVDEPVLSWRLD